MFSLEFHYGDKSDDLIVGYVDGSQPCLWLTADGRCEHYDIRPMICRDFEPGVTSCNEMRAALGLVLLPSVPDEDD